MNDPLQSISIPALAISAIPAIIVMGILYRWAVNPGTAVHAVARMIAQLFIVGYVLTFIFASNSSLVTMGVLVVMATAAAWISMRPLQRSSRRDYLLALLAICIGGVSTLGLISGLVFEITPWFAPRFLIPLAGMIFASCMNTVSLTAERFWAERDRGQSYTEARHAALNAALIPMINSLFAVGVVSLPGMMTGQILSGISPLVAARYQIVVMFMLFGASGLAAVAYLLLTRAYSRRAPAGGAFAPDTADDR